MALDPQVKAELAKIGLRAAIAVKIEIEPEIRIFDGSGIINLNSETYEGVDDLFGTLGGLETITEALSNRAPTVSLSLLIPDETAIANLLQPENQNSLVSVYFAVIDYATSTSIGSPELLWKGRLDTASITASENSHTVELNTVSAFDRLFAVDEGARLNSIWHNRIWPNETGLDRQIAGLRKVYWGQEGGSFAGGGGGGRGGGFTQPNIRPF